jgi:NADH:ubiquinone oxidoreductase subunit 6 (subunit J)
MSSSIENRETGSAIMIIGWVMMLFAFLVMFFNPAAIKQGETRFETIAACLVIVGLLMSGAGMRVRARNR